MLLDRTNHNRFSEQLAQRMAPAVIVTEVQAIPATDRNVTRNDNNPPSEIERAKEAFAELRDFLKDHPVILLADEAKLGAGYLERTRVTFKATREERDAQTRPLLDELTKIRGAYDLVREKTKTNEGGMLERAYNALRDRMTKYAAQVEAARIAEANRLREEAEEKERLARQAEAAELEAIDDADQGVESDVGAAIGQADAAFSDYRRADRQAAIAEKNVPLRTGSVLGGKSISMRTTEKLVIDDIDLAIAVLGMTDKIRDAILSSARDFRNEFNELPAGISATFERSY